MHLFDNQAHANQEKAYRAQKPSCNANKMALVNMAKSIQRVKINRNQQSPVKLLTSRACTYVVNNTAQNSSDNLLSYLQESHRYSGVVYWREQGTDHSTGCNMYSAA